MSDRNTDFPFLIDKSDRIDNSKEKISITVFGSYSEPHYTRLKKIAKDLRDEGYTNAKLVAERTFRKKRTGETDNTYGSEKSSYWILNSDVLIWIFYEGANNDGVSNEFGRLEFLVGIDRIWRSMIFNEVKQLNRRRKLSSMITGTIDKFITIQYYEFTKSNDENLLKMIKGRLPDYVNMILSNLKLR